MKNKRSDKSNQPPRPDQHKSRQHNENEHIPADGEMDTAAATDNKGRNQADFDAPGNMSLPSEPIPGKDKGSKETLSNEETLSSKKPDVIGQPLSSQPQKKRLTRNQKLKIALISAGGLLLLVALVLYLIYNSMLGQVTLIDARQETLPSEFDLPEERLVIPVPSEKGVINILLLGTDSTDPDNIDGRSDAMMILTINEKQGSIKLTSLQRDMLVYLPGRDEPDKINAANVYGGPLLALRVVNNMLRLDIEHYVVVNMSGMQEIIDIAGGVMIDVEQEQISFINRARGSDPVTEPGMQRLDGAQAVRYARIRKLDSDFVRMGRQRIVMQALLDAFMEASVVRKSQMISEGLGLVTTNLRPGQMIDLGMKILPKMSTRIEQMQLPIEGHYIEDSRTRWVIRADFNAMIPKLQDFIWGRTFDFDPVREIPGAPNSSIPLPTSPPSPTPRPASVPEVTPEPVGQQDPYETDGTEPETDPDETDAADPDESDASGTEPDDGSSDTEPVTDPDETDETGSAEPDEPDPEPTPEVTPEPTPEVTPEPTQEVTPEPTLEPTSKQTTKSTANETSKATTEPGSQQDSGD